MVLSAIILRYDMTQHSFKTMIQEMTSSLESAEFPYNRSHAAPFQRHGAPPKIIPRSDISFHNTANCESVDLLIRQFNSGLGSRQKNLMTPIPTPESANFSLLTLTPLQTPPSVSGLSNLFALYQIIKHVNPSYFSKRGNNFKSVLTFDGHKLFW